jgi:hypothetical protein
MDRLKKSVWLMPIGIFFGERSRPPLKKRFLVVTVLLCAFYTAPYRINYEVAVWTPRISVDDHFRPASLEAHVLTDFE